MYEARIENESSISCVPAAAMGGASSLLVDRNGLLYLRGSFETAVSERSKLCPLLSDATRCALRC